MRKGKDIKQFEQLLGLKSAQNVFKNIDLSIFCA